MSLGMALALTATMEMRGGGIEADELHGLDAADAGEIDVHEDDIRQVAAGETDAVLASLRGQQPQIRAAAINCSTSFKFAGLSST